ncbi:MAG: polysaccharide biosynthesis C-terminal domain-containing protein, partial [Thermoplasmatota archaeon]
VFRGTNRPEIGAKISVMGNIVNVALNIILIPDSIYGIPLMGLKEVGAALATLSAGIIISIASMIVSKRLADLSFSPSTLIHIGSAIFSGFILYVWEMRVMPIARFYDLFIYGAAMLAIYAAILYLVGEFTKKDWDYIMDSVHPGEMWHYIKDELTGKED